MQRVQCYYTDNLSASGSAKGRFPGLKAVTVSGDSRQLAGAELFAKNHIENREPSMAAMLSMRFSPARES
jgi:hypothetical protein